MATYGGNQLCVRFQETPVKDPLPENKSQAMPAHSPSVAKAMPGGVELAPGVARAAIPRHEEPAEPLAQQSPA